MEKTLQDAAGDDGGGDSGGGSSSGDSSDSGGDHNSGIDDQETDQEFAAPGKGSVKGPVKGPVKAAVKAAVKGSFDWQLAPLLLMNTTGASNSGSTLSDLRGQGGVSEVVFATRVPLELWWGMPTAEADAADAEADADADADDADAVESSADAPKHISGSLQEPSLRVNCRVETAAPFVDAAAMVQGRLWAMYVQEALVEAEYQVSRLQVQ
jgi:hypothetical protein